ncbi:MAG TPA: ATP-binding cassette domain-containing protein [Firmicutes bacterium]|nr:ATP-binding cassette domain-containing protein [Bacillota bacterium]
MLRIDKVTVSGDNGSGEKVEILDNVSASFDSGKMYAITGPNGGGKTSLAKLIMGIYRPSSGRILMDDRDITDSNITDRAMMGIGYAFQNPVRFRGLRVRDLLNIAAGQEMGGTRTSHRENMERFLRVVGLCPRDYAEREADGRLSGGELKRLEIAMMLARDPRIAIYDEPEAGVDLWTFERLLEVITNRQKNKKDGITIVITHNERFLKASDEILLMSDGRIQQQGDADEIWPMIRDDVACRWRASCGGELDEAECYR